MGGENKHNITHTKKFPSYDPNQKTWQQKQAEAHKDCIFMGPDHRTHPNMFYSEKHGYHHDPHHDECKIMDPKYGLGKKSWHNKKFGIHDFGHEPSK